MAVDFIINQRQQQVGIIKPQYDPLNDLRIARKILSLGNENYMIILTFYNNPIAQFFNFQLAASTANIPIFVKKKKIFFQGFNISC